MESLADRLLRLVAEHHGGSVRAAALEMGVPQPTLAQIVDGTVTNPRSATLQKIAAHYHTTVDWLLTGHGEPPAAPKPPDVPLAIADAVEAADTPHGMFGWIALVRDELGFRDDAEMAARLERLPLASFGLLGVMEAIRPDELHAPGALQATTDGWGDEIAFWSRLLRRFIAIYGIEHVRQQLIAHADNIDRRFSVPMPQPTSAGGKPARQKKASATKRRSK